MTESESQDATVEHTISDNGQHPKSNVDADRVTREQDGQYIQESSGLERVVVPHRQPGEGTLADSDLESIRAKNVTMDRSGAESIDAETVKMTNAGAKAIRATTIEMQNSGSMTVTGDRVSMNQSSALVVAGQHLDLHQSAVFAAQAESAVLQGESKHGLFVAGKVSAERDVRAIVGIIGRIEGKGRVEVMFDASSAAALGAGFALVLIVARRVFNRR